MGNGTEHSPGKSSVGLRDGASAWQRWWHQAHFVNTAVDNVRDAILIGSLFSILILFAFLRSWRATLISALAIPTTLAITFLFMHWVGATLNLMSLGGLAVAIGLIIDDTVVVVENIARHLTPGASHHAAGVRRQESGSKWAWYKPWTWGRKRTPATASSDAGPSTHHAPRTTHHAHAIQ